MAFVNAWLSKSSMNSIYITVLLSLLASMVVSVLSLSGALAFLLPVEKRLKLVPLLVSMAVGVLLGDAFIHLIPESAQELRSVNSTGITVALGILLFFLVEKVVRWKHDHSDDISPKPLGKMNLVGDAVHNFIDGVLIASAFLHSPTLGFITTIAVILHEIPQEIGDMGALLFSGYTPKRALWLNLWCSTTCIAGVLCTLIASTFFASITGWLLAIAAGGFIYISVCDFMPALQSRSSLKFQGAQIAMMLIGGASLHLVSWFESRAEFLQFATNWIGK